MPKLIAKFTDYIGNVSYISVSDGRVSHALFNGIPYGMSVIAKDEMALRFDCEVCETVDQLVAAIKRHAGEFHGKMRVEPHSPQLPQAPALPIGCYALSIDGDDHCELHLFKSDAEREAHLWEYAFENNGFDSDGDQIETLEEYKEYHDNDISEAMEPYGWLTDEHEPAPIHAAAPAMLAALKAMREKYGRLHDFLFDAIEGGRLTESMLPDDYMAITNTLKECSNADYVAGKAIAQAEGNADV